jgi:hypothetical protein
MSLSSLKKIKSQKIFFRPFNNWVRVSESNPIPSSSNIPSWYKDLPRFINNSNIPYKAHGVADLKMCSPFRESMTHGYLLVTPCELEVTRMADSTPEISWNPQYPHQPLTMRGNVNNQENQGFGMAVPLGCDSIMFAWAPLWGIKTPKNYSVLVTQPFNRSELPFVLTSGIIDSDKWFDAGNIPFFIRSDFIGVIPKGTPIAQIIPIKRDDWESKFTIEDPIGNSNKISLKDTYFYGYYHRFIRVKKSFK